MSARDVATPSPSPTPGRWPSAPLRCSLRRGRVRRAMPPFRGRLPRGSISIVYVVFKVPLGGHSARRIVLKVNAGGSEVAEGALVFGHAHDLTTVEPRV